ncbi:hypothetical protein ABK040_016117 [Willaertia magna]
MVKAYLLDNNNSDDLITVDSLLTNYGVTIHTFKDEEITNYETKIKELGFNCQNIEYLNPINMPNLEQQLIKFFGEHVHEFEEIRYVIEGESKGLFDVRDQNDKWIRIEIEKGDLIVIPIGIYHRFTIDEKRNLTVMRLYRDSPREGRFNRGDEGVENLECRRNYIEKYYNKVH